jgi:hypothetical protein
LTIDIRTIPERRPFFGARVRAAIDYGFTPTAIAPRSRDSPVNGISTRARRIDKFGISRRGSSSIKLTSAVRQVGSGTSAPGTSLPFKDVRAMSAIRGEADKICSA